ncbi:MAG TPA: alpha/beta hydrolase [Rubrobacteraceae bacterium]|nr:alpha/beta hydrolase [Rubrobacteraceae bacterium]
MSLLCSLQVVLPARTQTLWALTVLVKESSVLVTAFALLGLVLVPLVHLSGAPKRAMIAAALGAAAISLSLAPVAQAWRTASAEGVSLSLSEHFADRSFTVDREPETATYAYTGGEELELDVWRPPGGTSAVDEPGGRPAVVLVHGGGWRTGYPSKTPRWDAWLAEQGYVVFDIEYRLAPPPRWLDAPGDVKCAVGWVKRNAARYDVDPDRVALIGHSAGGHLALLSAYTEGDDRLPPSCAVEDTGVSAVAAFYPPTDLRRLYGMEWPWSSPNVVGLGSTTAFLGGTPSTRPARYRDASPTAHVNPGDPPTFLVHGGADRLVPPEQSERLAERLRGAGVPHRFVELPWANHSFDHAFDLSWSGWGSQITRSALEEFLDHNLAAQSVSDHGYEPDGAGSRSPSHGASDRAYVGVRWAPLR